MFPSTATEGTIKRDPSTGQRYVYTGGLWRKIHNTKAMATMGGVIDLEKTNLYTLTVSGAVSISFQNVLASPLVDDVILEVTNGGSAVVTFPASVKWDKGAPPEMPATGISILGFYTRDGGVTWRGHVMAANSK